MEELSMDEMIILNGGFWRPVRYVFEALGAMSVMDSIASGWSEAGDSREYSWN